MHPKGDKEVCDRKIGSMNGHHEDDDPWDDVNSDIDDDLVDDVMFSISLIFCRIMLSLKETMMMNRKY